MIMVVTQSTALQLLHPFGLKSKVICYASEGMVALDRPSE